MIGPTGFHHKKMMARFTGVDQAEVSSIVGMPPSCEAEWLAAGDLPWQTHSRDQISTVEVVDLMLTYLLYLEGWPREDSRRVVCESIAPVFFKAFLHVDHSLEVTGSQQSVERFRENFMRSHRLANDLTGGPYYFFHLIPSKAGQGFHPSRPQEPADGTAIGTRDICFRDIARTLVSKLGRPILSVQLESNASEDEPTVNWLSSARID